MLDITGGCLCGQLRYEANAEPIFSAVCHCKTCQKQSGTAFRVVIAVPRPAVSIQGSPKIYTRTGDSGQQVVNRFCPDCGSTVVIEPAALPGTTIIPAGNIKRRVLAEAHDGDLLRRRTVLGPPRRCYNAALPENAPWGMRREAPSSNRRWRSSAASAARCAPIVARSISPQ